MSKRKPRTNNLHANSVELGADDLLPRLIKVELPGRGGHVYMRELSGDMANLIPRFSPDERKEAQQKGDVAFAKRWLPLLAKVVVNSKSEPIFDEQTIHRLYDVIPVLMRLIAVVASQLSAEVETAKNGFIGVETGNLYEPVTTSHSAQETPNGSVVPN